MRNTRSMRHPPVRTHGPPSGDTGLPRDASSTLQMCARGSGPQKQTEAQRPTPGGGARVVERGPSTAWRHPCVWHRHSALHRNCQLKDLPHIHDPPPPKKVDTARVVMLQSWAVGLPHTKTQPPAPQTRTRRRISSSKDAQVRPPGSTNGHARSGLDAPHKAYTHAERPPSTKQ